MEAMIYNTSQVKATAVCLASGDQKPVKRRVRIGKKYHHISNTTRRELIERVEYNGETIIQVYI